MFLLLEFFFISDYDIFVVFPFILCCLFTLTKIFQHIASTANTRTEKIGEYTGAGLEPTTFCVHGRRFSQFRAGIFCQGICRARVDLCCLSLIVTFWVGILFLLSYKALCISNPFFFSFTITRPESCSKGF